LVVSSTPEETLSLVKYYLNNNEAREKIRNQGEKTVQAHSYLYRAKYMLDILKKENII
jgi:spore maturation protein CgeB